MTGEFHRRRIGVAITAAALALAGSAVALTVTGGQADAATTVDIGVTQSISGSSTSGSTIDKVTVHNYSSSATATNINLSEFLQTTSPTYLVHSSVGPCQISPPPTGFQILGSCQLGSLAPGQSVVETITWSGKAGTKFTAFMSVGSSQQDPVQKNNSSRNVSYFGPRAELALSATAAKGTKKGTVKEVTTVRDHGPNNASALQLITYIKGATSVGVSATPLSSCQIGPKVTGYDLTVVCVTDSLATAHNWVLTYTVTGKSGGKVTMKSTVTANTPADPVLSNNTATVSAAAK